MNMRIWIIRSGLVLIIVLLSGSYVLSDSSSEDIAATPLYRAAMEKFSQKDWQEAHRLLKRLHENHPDNPMLLNDLAVVSIKLEQPDLAMKLLEHAILSHPTLSVTYRNLQALYNYRASQEYKEALSLDSLELVMPQLMLVGDAQQAAASDRAPPQSPTQLATQMILGEEALSQPIVEEAQPESATAFDAQITASFEQWLAAWSGQDTDAYFNSYIEDYRPRSGTPHQRWRKLREDRIIGPQFIDIRASNLSIKKQDANNAALTFRQHYRSNLLNSVVMKKLEFHKTEDGWKIKSERVINPA